MPKTEKGYLKKQIKEAFMSWTDKANPQAVENYLKTHDIDKEIEKMVKMFKPEFIRCWCRDVIITPPQASPMFMMKKNDFWADCFYSHGDGHKSATGNILPHLVLGQGFPGTEKGVKLDEGKNRLGLVFQGFSEALFEVGRVGTFGANKYTENGWQSVQNGQSRYFDALFRHIFKYFNGEQVDSESKIHHLAHAAWNALAILSFEIWNKKQ